MVRRTRKIVWTENALDSQTAIFIFWNKKNKSNSYSKKLNQVFQENLIIISSFPEIGIATNNQNIRLKIIGHFRMMYHFSKIQITVLNIWDTRQNPENFLID